MKTHIQLEYVDAGGDKRETLMGLDVTDTEFINNFVSEYLRALEHDPRARLVFDGVCTCHEK